MRVVKKKYDFVVAFLFFKPLCRKKYSPEGCGLYDDIQHCLNDDKFITKYPKSSIFMFKDWAAHSVSFFSSRKNKFR